MAATEPTGKTYNHSCFKLFVDFEKVRAWKLSLLLNSWNNDLQFFAKFFYRKHENLYAIDLILESYSVPRLAILIALCCIYHFSLTIKGNNISLILFTLTGCTQYIWGWIKEIYERAWLYPRVSFPCTVSCSIWTSTISKYS